MPQRPQESTDQARLPPGLFFCLSPVPLDIPQPLPAILAQTAPPTETAHEALLEHPGLEPRRTRRRTRGGRPVQAPETGRPAQGQEHRPGVLQPVDAHPHQLRAGCVPPGRPCRGAGPGQGRLADRVRAGHGHGRRDRGAHRRSREGPQPLRRPDRRARLPEVRRLGQRPPGQGADRLREVRDGTGDQHGDDHPSLPGAGARAGAAGTLRHSPICAAGSTC